MTIEDLKSGFCIGMHGLGMIHGIPHSNSKEAFEYWKKKRIHFFEADIAVTSDGDYILLAHNACEKDFRKIEIFDKPIDGRYSLSWIKEINDKTRGSNLTIITIEEFLNLAVADESLVVMIDMYDRSMDDLKSVGKIIQEYGHKFPGLTERILLELYTLSDIDEIKALYKDVHIIACIKELKYDFWEGNKNYSRLNNVDFISCKWKYVREESNLINYCNKNKIGVLSLSRFDNQIEKKRKSGINVNIVDVKGNYISYFKNMFLFGRHYLVSMIKGKVV